MNANTPRHYLNYTGSVTVPIRGIEGVKFCRAAAEFDVTPKGRINSRLRDDFCVKVKLWPPTRSLPLLSKIVSINMISMEDKSNNTAYKYNTTLYIIK